VSDVPAAEYCSTAHVPDKVEALARPKAHSRIRSSQTKRGSRSGRKSVARYRFDIGCAIQSALRVSILSRVHGAS